MTKFISIIMLFLLIPMLAFTQASVKIPSKVNEVAMACSTAERWEQEQWNYASTLEPKYIKPKPITAEGYCVWLPQGKEVTINGHYCKKLAEIIVDGQRLCVSIVKLNVSKP